MKTRLERYRAEFEEEKRRLSEDVERRIGEMSQLHQNLVIHHKITKRMLQAREVGEVFDALLVGVSEGTASRERSSEISRGTATWRSPGRWTA